MSDSYFVALLPPRKWCHQPVMGFGAYAQEFKGQIAPM